MAADWRIGHVEQLCRVLGLSYAPPRAGGAHGTVAHPRLASILTVPVEGATKPVFIRALIALSLASGASDGLS